MMKFARTAFVLALILPAAACNTTVYDMAALQRTTPQGSEFTKQLAADYLSLAQSEARQFDWVDSNYFAKKGRRAAAGEVVLPEDPDTWSKMPEGTQPALRDARARLMSAQDGGARDRAPQLAARAQSHYDCWVEQQQENWQTADIAACRDAFYSDMTQLEARPVAQAAPTPAPTQAAPAPQPVAQAETYIVFFAFDRSDISPVGATVLDRAVAEFRRTGSTKVRIDGFTDRSGTDGYNQALSERRAKSVAAYLNGKGVPATAIATQAFGETRNRVATADGEKNPENRRAEISFGK